MSSKVIIIVTISLVFIMLTTMTTAITLTRVQREATPDNPDDLPLCSDSTTCGWAVYTPFSRRVDYFVKNTMCACKPGTKCIRATDDLSVSAYVYQCLSIENNSTPSPAS